MFQCKLAIAVSAAFSALLVGRISMGQPVELIKPFVTSKADDWLELEAVSEYKEGESRYRETSPLRYRITGA